MRPLLIYVAGPYTGSSRQEIDHNVNRAIDAGIEIFNKGHSPYVPHLTDLIDRRAKQTGKELSWADFMAWDAPWLAVCDALLFIGESKGANIELEEAKRTGKTIFLSINDIPKLERPANQFAES